MTFSKSSKAIQYDNFTLLGFNISSVFFGLFNTFGKAAAFIGPALIGIFLAIFKDTTLMLLPLLILFVLGIVVLYFVDTDEVI